MQKSLSVIALFVILLFVSSSFATISPAVQVGMNSVEPQNAQSLTFTMTVPPLPVPQVQAGFEFHAGLLSMDNSTLMKTTLSYGCQIAAHKACFPPFLNRYIFYVTILNTVTTSRLQLPSQGYAVTPGSLYNVTIQAVNPCVLQHSPAWSFSIKNSTTSFSTKVCSTTIDSPPLNKNFDQVVAGLLEIHNVTLCSQFPSQGSFTQNSISALYNATRLPLNWVEYISPNPLVNCNFNDTASNGNQTVQINWTP